MAPIEDETRQQDVGGNESGGPNVHEPTNAQNVNAQPIQVMAEVHDVEMVAQDTSSGAGNGINFHKFGHFGRERL